MFKAIFNTLMKYRNIVNFCFQLTILVVSTFVMV